MITEVNETMDDKEIEGEELVDDLSRVLLPAFIILTWFCLCLLLCKIRSVARISEQESSRRINEASINA